jgi:hypothetical protein
MKRRERIALVTVMLASVIGGVLLLTYTGSRSLGPLSRLLNSIGVGISDVESRYAQRVRGSGRAEQLEWLQPYRASAQSLRNPDRILLGAYDAAMPGSYEGVAELERTLGVTFPLLHFYTAWGDKPDQAFPIRSLQAITNLGSIPVITWEPWLSDFDSRRHPELPLPAQRDRGGLAAIGRGDYDFYIDSWAVDAAAFDKPILVRFAHEMNDPYRYPWGPQNNSAGDFIAAWRRVIERFRAAGADNVEFVWAPHVAYKGFNDLYPGDEWVDWVGTGTLNFGTVAHWSQWWTFDEIFGEKYGELARHKKPVMIAEIGSLAVGGDRAKWFRDGLADLPKRYPQVKAVLFFNVPKDATLTYQTLDWTFAQDSAVVTAIRSSIATWEVSR